MDYPEAKPRIRKYLAVLWKGRIVQSGDREAMFTPSNPSCGSSSPAPRAGSSAWSDPRPQGQFLLSASRRM